jgi:hypothetical protein
MRATERAVAGIGRHVAVVLALSALVACSSDPPPPATPGKSGAITRVGDDFLEIAGDDIFGDIAAGGGSVWMATLKGVIQVDPSTMEATWHTNAARGKNIVYAFDSLWVTVSSGLVRLDPTSMEQTASIRITQPEGIAAGEESIWTSQHGSREVLRIDPRTNEITETIDLASADFRFGAPMDPAVVDGEVWVAMGNGSEVLRIDGRGKVTRIDLTTEVLTPAVATPEALWFSNAVEYDGRVTRVDRATGVVSDAVLPESALPRAAAVGTGIYVADTLWFPTSAGVMVAIDTVTFDVLGTVSLKGSMPRNAVEYDGAVWLASELGGSIERVPLERLAEELAAAG